MIYIVINAPAILVAAVAGIAIASFWYRKRLPVASWAILFLANLWLGAILAGALILAPPKGGVWTMTIGSAIVIWAGFVAPALAGSYRLRNIRFRALMADCGYWLAAMVAQAVLMRLIGLTAPPVG
jgi:hypothetical protein